MVLITELPDVVIDKIMSFFTYDEIAKNRIVSRWFNKIGWRILNSGYFAAEQNHKRRLKEVKAKLPRRESERRGHSLARISDILIAIDTRLSMLSMTYGRFIDTQLCCFIPGKVLDELFKVLKSLDNPSDTSRPHDVLQELRDISTMAIEYFDEKIAPELRKSFTEHQTEYFMHNSLAHVLAGVTLPFEPLTQYPAKQLPMIMHSQTTAGHSAPLELVAGSAIDESLMFDDSTLNSTIAEVMTKFARHEVKKSEDTCRRNMDSIKNIINTLVRKLKDRSVQVASLTNIVSSQATILSNHAKQIRALRRLLKEYNQRLSDAEVNFKLNRGYLPQNSGASSSKRIWEENATGKLNEMPMKRSKPSN